MSHFLVESAGAALAVRQSPGVGEPLLCVQLGRPDHHRRYGPANEESAGDREPSAPPWDCQNFAGGGHFQSEGRAAGRSALAASVVA
jgi:hypothetical protein